MIKIFGKGEREFEGVGKTLFSKRVFPSPSNNISYQ
jgi:hypothetical protein